MQKSAKAFLATLKKDGVFYTSEKLALYLKSLIDDAGVSYSEVYDPTCGAGALLKVFPDDIKKYGQDIDGAEVEKAERSIKNFVGVAGNTLEQPAFQDKKFFAISFNAPFSVSWNADALKDDARFARLPAMPPKSKADYAFLAHIMHCLEDGGVAAGLCFPGILYRKNAEGKIRRYFVEHNYIEKIIAIPPKQFDDTAIGTVALVLRKGRKENTVTFVNEQGTERTVDFSEIKENDFNLSVNSYIQEEDEKEPIDIDAINAELYELFFTRFEKDLAMFVFEKDELGIARNFYDIRNRIEKILDDFEQRKLF